MISREISANEQPSQTDPAPLMEVLFEEVQDTVILDVAQSVHRAHHWKQRLEAASIGKPASHARNKSLKWEGGESSWPHWQQQQQQREVQIVPLAPQRGSKGPVDVFGQSHPARATEIVTCRNCGRQVQAGMFAPHLEKCMGKGRAAGRAASKRIQAQTRLD